MNEDLQAMAQAANNLANRLPGALVQTFAEAIAQAPALERPDHRVAILRYLPTADFRDVASDFLDQWQTVAKGVSAQTAATALLTAGQAAQVHCQEHTVEIVWTGPETLASTFRQTEQAILEVLQSASSRLAVVSFAIYRIPRIRDALMAAANRGVQIRLIVETPNHNEGKIAYDSLLALGEKVASVSTIYFWSQATPRKGDNGKTGILHVKCAVSDGYRLFLSRANLTEYAFTINMELGLLITGGRIPGQIEKDFERLIERGTFIKV